MRRAFSIAELIIVAAIIGILAALVVPYARNQATEAKEAAAKDNLRTLRGAIELYAANHGGVAPGYEGNQAGLTPSAELFRTQTIDETNYLRGMPANPFNNRGTVLVIGNDTSLPDKATGEYGWVYQPATKTICLDWPGEDRRGVRYFDY